VSPFRAEILACASEVLGPDVRLGDGSSLFAAGRLDSIVSVEWLSVLEARFGVQLDDEAFFAVRSIDELVTLIAAATASEPPPESGLAIVREMLGCGLGDGRTIEVLLLWCQPDPWPPASWRDEARVWPLVVQLGTRLAPRAGERVGVFGCDGVIVVRDATAAAGDDLGGWLPAARDGAPRGTSLWARRLAFTAANVDAGDGTWAPLADGATHLPVTRRTIAVPGQLFLADGPAIGAVQVTTVGGGRMVSRLASRAEVPPAARVDVALRGGHRVSCRVERCQPPGATGDAVLVARIDEPEALETVSRALAAAAEAEVRAEFGRVRDIATPGVGATRPR